MIEIKAHTSNKLNFEKRLSRWFDAFLLMKYMHFARNHYYPDVDVKEAANWLLNKILPENIKEEKDAKNLLLKYRKIDVDFKSN